MLQKIWLSIAALLLCMPAAWAQQKNIIKTVAKTAARDVKAAETGSAVKHLTAATQGTAHRAAKASASNAVKLSAHRPAERPPATKRPPLRRTKPGRKPALKNPPNIRSIRLPIWHLLNPKPYPKKSPSLKKTPFPIKPLSAGSANAG